MFSIVLTACGWMQYQQTVSSLLCKLGLWIPTKFKDKNYNSTRFTCILNNYSVLLIISRLILCQTMWDKKKKTPDAIDDQNCPDSNMDNIDLLQKSNYMKLTKGLLDLSTAAFKMDWKRISKLPDDLNQALLHNSRLYLQICPNQQSYVGTMALWWDNNGKKRVLSFFI